MCPTRKVGEVDWSEPILMPLSVGSMGIQDLGGGNEQPGAMTAAIDLDELPSLREAFERHASGKLLDLITQWRGVAPHDTSQAPIALLRVGIAEFDLAFQVQFNCVDYKRSLLVAARTGRVLLLEVDLDAAMRSEPWEKAMTNYLSMGMTVPDVEPLRRLLQGRFDLPLPDTSIEAHVVKSADVASSLKAFLRDARPPEAMAIVSEAGLSVIVIADSRREVISAQIREGRHWVNWASARCGALTIVRMDVLCDDSVLKSYVLHEPDQNLIRVTSMGGHAVVIVEKISEDLPADEFMAQIRAGLTFVASDGAQAMRALLK